MKPARTKGAPSRRKSTTGPAPESPVRIALAFVGVAAIVGLFLYAPAFRGEFIFDDSGLPFFSGGRDEPLIAWISGVRPALMFSYWLNHVVSGDRPAAYHAVNLGIHALNAGLVFLALWRLLAWSQWGPRRRKLGALLGATVFLIHPLQTESVSYIAGRSESLSALFVLLAYTLFLYRRRPAISWVESAGVLALFGIAVMTKENAVSLAGLLILTDTFWPVPFSLSGLRRNWRMYALMLPGAVVAAGAVLRMLLRAPTAGFSIREITPYEYALTQARAMFTYLRLFVAPVGQSVDHDFAISRSLFQHGAVLWAVLLGALIFVAIRFRRTMPLACFGLLFFLIALAPTSSVVPIMDPLVERRMYLPLVGLILIAGEIAARLRLSPSVKWSATAVALLALALACQERNRAWSRPSQLFEDAAMRSTHNPRPVLNLTERLVREGRCADAVPYLERADRLFSQDPRVDLAWSWALECQGRKQDALDRLERARNLQPSSRVYEHIGLIYGEMGRLDDAGRALQHAVALDPQSSTAHSALAVWYEAVGNLKAAGLEYEKSLSLDRRDPNVRVGLMRVRSPRPAPDPAAPAPEPAGLP